jgi:hypothetical protein
MFGSAFERSVRDCREPKEFVGPRGKLHCNVDALESHDIAVAREAEPGEKLEQALELMAVGFRLKLDALRNRRPDASEAEIRAEFEQWLSASD